MTTLALMVLALSGGIECKVRADEPPLPVESEPPPVRYTLKIGDQTVEIVEGQPLQLDAKFDDPRILLKAHPNRVFPYRGLQFEFPRDYTFEAEIDAFSSVWTLSGTDYTIMVMEFPTPMKASEFLDNIGFELNSESLDRKPTDLVLQDSKKENPKRRLQGLQDRFAIGNQVLHYEVLELPRYRGRRRLLTFLDVLDDYGKPSDDAVHTRQLIAKTLRFQEQDL